MLTGGRRRGKDYSIVLRRLIARCDLAEQSPFHTFQSMRIGHSFLYLKERESFHFAQKEAPSLLGFSEGTKTQAEVLAMLLEHTKEQQVKAGSVLSSQSSF